MVIVSSRRHQLGIISQLDHVFYILYSFTETKNTHVKATQHCSWSSTVFPRCQHSTYKIAFNKMPSIFIDTEQHGHSQWLCKMVQKMVWLLSVALRP